jgi:hypothetical protein
MVTSVALGEPYDVYVGRNPAHGPTHWGNWAAKYAYPPPRTPEEQVEAYRRDFERRGLAPRARAELAGAVLACHCARRTWSPPCHAEFLADVANSPPLKGS